MKREKSLDKENKMTILADQKTKIANHSKTLSGDGVKRIFDAVISALGMLILSPVFIAIALYIKWTSPGPVFYRGPRVGQFGKKFTILKFRTMKDGPKIENGSRITAADDPRITPGGHWLRETKLNELPQLWNVIKGEMSLVGPRPEDPEVVLRWSEQARLKILSVRPGVTSPASIFFRDEERLLKADSVMDHYLNSIVPSKLRLDQIYVDNHSFLGDLDVLFMTSIALMPNLRDQKIPEQWLVWGPLSRIISRHLNWLLVDIPIAFVSVGISGALWRAVGPLNLGWGPALILAVVIALLFGVVNAILGMNRISWSDALPSDALGLGISIAITTLILIASDLLGLKWVHLPIGMWVMTSILAFSGFVVARYRLRLVTGLASRWLSWRGSSTRLGERVLIVGSGEMAQFAVQLIRQGDNSKAFTILGLIDDDPKKAGVHYNGVKVMGATQDIPQLVERWDVGIILFAIGNIQIEKRKAILDQCRQTAARIVLIPDLFEMLSECLFAFPVPMADDSVSPDSDGHIPAPVVVKWLTELEVLAHPDNEAMISRLRQLRNALAIHLTDEQP